MFNNLKKAIQWYCNESAKVYDDRLHSDFTHHEF